MMNHIKDIHRVEDVIIPALLATIAEAHINSAPKDKDAYEEMLTICYDKIYSSFEGGDRAKLKRRAQRIIDKLMLYFRRNKFDTRKMFLATIEWVRCLLAEELLIIIEDSPLAELLKDLDSIVINAPNSVENYDKIYRSAVNHVLPVHEIATKEGYFIYQRVLNAA